MDSVLADLDFAIANAETSRKVSEVTKVDRIGAEVAHMPV